MAFFNPARASYRENPYPSLHRLRAEDPVHRSPELRGWVLTRYEDCGSVLRDASRFANDPARASGTLGAQVAGQRERSPLRAPVLGSTDPPVHTRLRAIVNRAFTPRMVEAARPRVAEIARRLLDDASRGDTFDFMQAVAEPLPVLVLGELLGLDDAVRGPVRQWAQLLMRASGDDRMPEPDRRAAFEARDRLRDYLARYSSAPVAKRERPLIRILVEAHEEGESLSEDELVSFVAFLYSAGAGPTAFLLGNLVLALAGHPEQLAMLRDERSLIPDAIEETLRWDSPTHVLLRIAVADTRVGTRRITAGEPVFAVVGAANRDPAVFPEPDRFDVRRERGEAHQVSFGLGPHFCLGAPLARIIAEETLHALFDASASLEVERSGVQRGDTFLLRGPGRLPLALRTA